MANRLYNKQVSPKGYKMGGMSTKSDNKKDIRKVEQMTGASRSSKREKGRARKMGGGMMMQRPMMQKGGKLKMVMKGGKKVPFFAADGKGAKDLGKAAMKKGGIAKLNPGLKAFMKKKMAKKK